MSLRIRDVPHRPVSQENYNQCSIAQHPDDENDEKDHRNDVGFRTLGIRRVGDVGVDGRELVVEGAVDGIHIYKGKWGIFNGFVADVCVV